MSSWTDTPFSSIEEAYETATKFGLNPSPITEKDSYRSFSSVEGNKVYLIAQPTTGGPVKEQEFKKRGKDRYRLPKQEGPFFVEQDRLIVGPWCHCDERTLEEVEAHYRKIYINFDNVEVLDVKLYRIDDDEYEYVADSQGVWLRSLTSRSFAGRDDFQWALARELFGTSDPTPEQKQKITAACHYVLYTWPDKKEKADGAD